MSGHARNCHIIQMSHFLNYDILVLNIILLRFSKERSISMSNVIWIHIEYTSVWKNICIVEICSLRHTIWSLRVYIYIWCPMMMSSPYHTLWKWESIVFWWCLLMLEIEILFNIFLKKCMLITSIAKNYEECSTSKFDNNRAYSRAWGSSTIGDGWSSTLFTFIFFIQI